MASCKPLTTGRGLACPANGGVKAFYTLDSDVEFTIDAATRVVTDFDTGGSASTVFKWDIRSASNVIQTLTTVAANRAGAEVSQVFTGILHRLDYATNNELLLIAYSQCRIIAHLYNGDAILLGREFGCNLDSAAADSGSGITEFNGYTLTVSALEMEYANYLEGSTIDDPFAGMTTTPVISTPNDAPAASPVTV